MPGLEDMSESDWVTGLRTDSRTGSRADSEAGSWSDTATGSSAGSAIESRSWAGLQDDSVTGCWADSRTGSQTRSGMRSSSDSGSLPESESNSRRESVFLSSEYSVGASLLSCGHTVCDACVAGLQPEQDVRREDVEAVPGRDGVTCPVDGLRFADREVLPLSYGLEQVGRELVRCLNARSGCPFVAELKHLKEHCLENCRFRPRVGTTGVRQVPELVFVPCALIAAAADQEAREIVESEEIRKAGARCVSRPTTIPTEYTDDRKTHFRRVLDSEEEPECSSESDDEILPESVCEPVLGSTQETVVESPCEPVFQGERESGGDSARDPIPQSSHELVHESAREPVLESVPKPVPEAHSGITPSPGIAGSCIQAARGCEALLKQCAFGARCIPLSSPLAVAEPSECLRHHSDEVSSGAQRRVPRGRHDTIGMSSSSRRRQGPSLISVPGL
ncbi:hypothetical protein MTO96_036700 [Rhipicephalus appendiculatus]